MVSDGDNIEFGLEDCKVMASAVGISTGRATAGFWDAFCKLAIACVACPETFWHVWAKAIAFAPPRQAAGLCWRYQEVRQLKAAQARERREREEAELQSQIDAMAAAREGRPDRLIGAFRPSCA